MNKRTSVLPLIAAAAIPLFACGEPAPPLTVIRGTLLGHDGHPMPMAHVHLSSASDFFRTAPLESVQAGENGSFDLRTEKVGGFLLKFSGVDHANVALPVITDPPSELGVDVQLTTYAYNEDFSDVRILGDFNDWDYESALPLEARSDGTYAVTIETGADTLAYGLVGVLGGMGEYVVNGTQSDAFVYSGEDNHHYRSVVHATDGQATIVFDPEQLVRSDRPTFAGDYGASDQAVIGFHDSTSVLARLQELVRAYAERSRVLAAAESTDSARAEAVSLVAEMVERVQSEPDALARQVSYLAVLAAAEDGFDVDPTTLRQALVELPPTSATWSFMAYAAPGYVAAALGGLDTIAASASSSGQVDDCPYDEYLAYLETGAAAHTDPAVRSMMLYGMVMAASEADREEAAAEYHRRLVDEYPQSMGAYFAKPYASDRNVRVGHPIPQFTLVSLDDPQVVYTRDSMLGKPYLLDFWATWCAPCVDEMATLHQVYEDYAPLGLEILSVSLDVSPDEIHRFRGDEWTMPWLHTHVGADIESEHLQQFEIIGIPHGILVGADGVILAAGPEDLLGEALRETLVELLGEAG